MDFPPAIFVKGVKVIRPLVFECVVLFVVCLHFDPVVSYFPGHVRVFKTLTPAISSTHLPEVHKQVLRLVLEVHVLCILNFAHLHSIYLPFDVIWFPYNLIVVPGRPGFEIFNVVLIHCLILRNDISADWFAHRWDNLNIDFIPAPLGPIWTLPIGKESGNCASLSTGLHPNTKSTIFVSFSRFDTSTFILLCSVSLAC